MSTTIGTSSWFRTFTTTSNVGLGVDFRKPERTRVFILIRVINATLVHANTVVSHLLPVHILSHLMTSIDIPIFDVNRIL